MCNWIILFLLFCNGGCGNFLSGNGRGNNDNDGCGCGNNRRGSGWDNGRGNGRGNNDNDDCGCDNNDNRSGRGGFDNRDWDNERNRNGNTPPPWVRSNYSNGDTCGCEEQ